MNRQKPEIWMYEMAYDGDIPDSPRIECFPLSRERYAEYMGIYNACFYPMRRALEIEPYLWYSNESQIARHSANIYALVEGGCIMGAVTCHSNEIDDLIVKPSTQHRGYGKKLLLWAMRRIRKSGNSEMILHVAAWNERAMRLYQNAGFVVKKKERIR